MMKEIRKGQIKRRKLLIMSYVNCIIGMLDMYIALWYRYNLTPRDKTVENIYLFLGILITLVGLGGANYEEVIKRRASKSERMLHICE